jgi:hypothetical protein
MSYGASGYYHYTTFQWPTGLPATGGSASPGYETAFQANSSSLWTVGSAGAPSLGTANLGIMAA